MNERTSQLQAARTIVAAVNAGDAALYASVFAEDAIVRLYGGPTRVSGRAALVENRRRHFAAHPSIHCEIQHLAAVGNVVVMHDRVRLGPDAEAMDVVEIYTFDDRGLIKQVDVIQAAATPNPPRES